MGGAMTKSRSLIVPAVVLGIALLVLAGLYFVDSADALPPLIPGHEVGSTHHHIKHGIAAGDRRPRLLHLRLVSELLDGRDGLIDLMNATLNTALLGSRRIAKRDPLGTSIGPITVSPPSSPALAMVASASSQAK